MRTGLILTAGSLIFTGCSMTGLGGSDTYDCKAPPGISCKSLSGVYANAVANNLPSDKVKAKGSVSKKNADSDKIVGDAPTTGTPILSEPKVLRVWIAPWEDGKKVLHDQSYLYAVVDPGHWQIAHTQQKIANQYRVFAPAKQQGQTAGAASGQGGGAAAQPAMPQYQMPSTPQPQQPF